MGQGQTSRNHHYVPQAILREFCVTGDSTYYLSRDGFPSDPTLRNVKSIFRRRHYNSSERLDGTKDDSIERFFAYELDNHIPAWIEAFKSALETGELRFPSAALRYRFIQFFYNHHKRTPDFIDPLVEQVTAETLNSNFVAEFERNERLMTKEEKELLDDTRFRERVMRNSRVENFGRQSIAILSRLERMKVVVATPQEAKKSFIVASNPVARFEDFPLQELGTPGVELWTTFSPRIAVGFVAKLDAPDCIAVNYAEVRKLNLTLARNSRAIASQHPRLMQSLCRSAW